MSPPPSILWLSAMALCASVYVAEPVSAEELLPPSPRETIANHLFSESDPWIQTVSLQCTDASSCDASGESVCRKCDSHRGCCDGLLTRPGLTNGLFGLAPTLAEHGILVDASYTNFYQGVASGGAEQIFRYGGKTDLFIMADTGKVGLWEGGQL